MSEKPESYEAAVERLEEIIDRLDSGQAGLRETLDLCREGRELVTYCAAELDAVGEGLKELQARRAGREARLLSASAEPAPAPARSQSRVPGPGSRGRGPSRVARRGDRELAAPIAAIVASSCSRPAPSRSGRAVTTGSSGRSRKT